MLSLTGATIVTVALGFELAGQRERFAAALHAAPLLTLLLVGGLQLVALLARSEAWHACVAAAGGTMSRRLLFRAAGVGYLASVFNGSVGLATRVACLRAVAPSASPPVPALLAAEVPMIAVEVGLAAVFSFSLVGTLGIPWWLPIIAVASTAAAAAGLQRVSNRRQLGLWAGLAVMRQGRTRMIAFVLLAVGSQVARNWLALDAVGVHISVIDATALLIAMFTLGQIPIGPGLAAAASVLVLGAHGIAATAAAGVLLTATATAAALIYAAWSIADHALSSAHRHVEIRAEPTHA